MTGSEPIDLAHAPGFRLGGVEVRPALRQLARDDGAEEVLEPRVMQVLIALAQASGGVVTRDELTRRCWEGRVVGEDAINRVISRLRRAAEGIGAGAFRIETLTKVGYRLLVSAEAAGATGTTPLPDEPSERAPRRMGRRAILAGSGAAVLAGAGTLALTGWLRDPHAAPSDVAPLLQQARLASRQGSVDGMTQAMGLLRRVTERHPDYADGWGLLAVNYASLAGGVAREEVPQMRARSKEAARRAFALDPDNGYARFATVMIDGRPRSWRSDETLARDVLATNPRDEMALNWLAGLLMSVGRCREAVEINDRVVRLGLQPDPGSAYIRAVMLWAVDRLDEADRASAEAYSLYPRHFAVWFSRYYLLMYTGRATEALAMSRNVQTRPAGYSDANFAMIDQVAQAILTRAPSDVEAAVALALDWAHRGAGFAENSVQFCSALGDLDAAFRVAEAYYFGRGFQTGENRYEPDRRVFTRLHHRRTRILFLPSTAAMRGDPRFAPLIEEIGLARYWRESGTRPDYQS